jgi:hypothetical protein
MMNTCCQRLDLCRATLLGVRHGRRRYRIDPTALHARRMYHGRQQCRRFDLGRWVGARRTARTAFGRRQRHPRACRCHPGAHGHVKSKRSDDCFVGRCRQSAFVGEYREAAIRAGKLQNTGFSKFIMPHLPASMSLIPELRRGRNQTESGKNTGATAQST